MLNIAGISKLSTVDWPGNLVTTVFLQGCPWRCNYCHNSEILDPRVPGTVNWETEVIPHLQSRIGLLDGIVFSGGEPTMQANAEDGGELFAAIKQVRSILDPRNGNKPAFKIGLHTGGAYTQALKKIIHEVDWIGFDVKAPIGMYDKITNVNGSDIVGMRSLELVQQEIEFRKNTDRPLNVTFRTTIDPTVLKQADVKRLQEQLAEKGIDNLVLQEVRTLGAPAGYEERLGEALNS
jgi:pyruvate formate lyase activating enzyme